MEITMQRGAGVRSYICEPAAKVKRIEVGMFKVRYDKSPLPDRIRVNIGTHLPHSGEWTVSFENGVIKVTPPSWYWGDIDPSYDTIELVIPPEHKKRIVVVEATDTKK